MKTSKDNYREQPIVVFGEDWGKHPSSTQHLVKELSKSRKVIWINSIGLRKPKYTLRDIVRVGKKVISFFKGNKAVNSKATRSQSFTVISPFVFPCAESKWLIGLNKWCLSKQLAKPLSTLRQKPVLWCSLPTAVDYISLFNSSISFV